MHYRIERRRNKAGKAGNTGNADPTALDRAAAELSRRPPSQSPLAGDSGGDVAPGAVAMRAAVRSRAMTEPATDPRAALRERLLAMLADLVETMLRDGYSAGLGATLAGIAAVLDALDTVIPPVGDAVPPSVD
jgi:hypothetical protein